MSNSWCILTTRMGADIRSPSDEELQTILKEVLSATDQEHPNSWLRFGYDTGPMFLLDVYIDGTILFGQWLDTDYDKEFAPEGRLERVSFDDALRLWRALQRGDLDTIRCQEWVS